MLLGASLLIIQHYKIQIKGKLSPKEKRPSLHFGIVAIEKGVFGLLSTTVDRLIYICTSIYIYIYIYIYRERERERDYSKLILVEQQFCSNDHDFNRDAVLFIIERIYKKKHVRRYYTDKRNTKINL